MVHWAIDADLFVSIWIVVETKFVEKNIFSLPPRRLSFSPSHSQKTVCESQLLRSNYYLSRQPPVSQRFARSHAWIPTLSTQSKRSCSTTPCILPTSSETHLQALISPEHFLHSLSHTDETISFLPSLPFCDGHFAGWKLWRKNLLSRFMAPASENKSRRRRTFKIGRVRRRRSEICYSRLGRFEQNFPVFICKVVETRRQTAMCCPIVSASSCVL